MVGLGDGGWGRSQNSLSKSQEEGPCLWGSQLEVEEVEWDWSPALPPP